MEQLTETQFKACREQFLKLGETALTMNHYQLAIETNIENPIIWKMFLLDPRITDYINSEMNIIRNAGINEIIKQAPNSRSVGQAQLINALTKIDESAADKKGPVFIYTYVPLNAEQKYAPNISLYDNEDLETLLEESEELPEVKINADTIASSIPSR